MDDGRLFTVTATIARLPDTFEVATQIYQGRYDCWLGSRSAETAPVYGAALASLMRQCAELERLAGLLLPLPTSPG